MSLEVKIEIRSTVKKELNLADGNTHSFTVFVQGLNDNHIEHFIKEVVFYLPFNAPNTKEVRKNPPYLISGSTDASFRLSIDLFLYASQNFNKLRYSYFVVVPDKPVEKSVCVKTLTFLNSPQDFRERLLLGGAEVVDHEKKSKAVLTNLICKKEPVEIIENQDVKIKEENSVQLPNTSVQSKGVAEENSNLVIQNIYCFDELLKENGILKEENERLRKNCSAQESVIATCAEKLPVLKHNFYAADMELNQLKQKAEANEVELANLKSLIHIIKTEMGQYKNTNELKGTRKCPEIPVISL